jgi:hypothetical protein
MHRAGLSVHRPKGFVLVAALGVLAVLMTAAFMAAGSAQHTFTMTVERQRDRRIADHLTVASELLPKLVSRAGTGVGTIRTVRLVFPTEPSTVEVSATLGLAIPSGLIQPALSSLDGDELAVVEARRRDGAGPSRRSTFVVNSRGLRTFPILIREERL